MKKIILILLCCITAVMTQAQNKNWCETLVNSLNASEDVDKTIAVKRDPSTHEITNATYDYRFSSDNLYKKIANSMKSHYNNADYYTEKGKKLKTIILRFNDRGRRWSCKLQCLDKKGKQFLISVSSSDQSSSDLQGLIDVESMQDFKERQQEWAKQYKERQQEWAKQARERQQQTRERQRALQQQTRERQRALQQQARERQRELSKQNQARTYITTNEQDADYKKALEQHNNELKKAEQERKRKLLD